MCILKFGVATAPSFLFFSIALTAQAQIIPDTTLPTNSIVSTDGNTSIITGGTQSGGNLFHSFEQFSLPTGSGAFFDNAIDIQNIFSRVTGGSISNIDGFLRANGTANLFLLNPNGIIFGKNASLELGGSFVGSSADRLLFPDGTYYSATETQTVPLLTINVPIGLQFGGNPGEIVNRSQAFDARTNTIAGIQVTSGNTLALVGGNIEIEGGVMRAIDGNLELGSVGANSQINFTVSGNLFAFDYADVSEFKDIQLSQQSQVSVGDRGLRELNIQGRNILLTDNSVIRMESSGSSVGGNMTIRSSETISLQNSSSIRIELFSLGQSGRLTLETGQLSASGGSTIVAQAFNAGRGGNVAIRANSIELVGTAPIGFPITGIFALARSTADVGDIAIETDRLSVRDGAQISASTTTSGNAGNITIRANSVDLRGTTPNPILNSTELLPSWIVATTGGEGNAGTITIDTDRLSVQDGASVAVATGGSGQAGNIRIHANSIELSGQATDRSRDFYSSNLIAGTVSEGNAGNIEIKTEKLTVQDGAFVAVNTQDIGNAGSITIRANSIDLNGQTFHPSEGNVSSAFNASTSSQGDAGSIVLETEDLRVQDFARVLVNSTSSGNPGNIDVNTNFLRLDNQGSFSAASATGRGGNINLAARNIQLRHQSLIGAAGSPNLPTSEGNIGINAETLVLLESSQILTSSTDPQGGSNIAIAPLNSSDLVLLQSPDSRINARGELTISGEIQPEPANLPQVETTDAESLLSRGCQDYQGSSFYVTGRGGIPPSPFDPLSGSAVVEVDWVEASNSSEASRDTSTPTIQRPESPLIEAQGWIVGENGEIILTAAPYQGTPYAPGIPTATCFSDRDKN